MTNNDFHGDLPSALATLSEDLPDLHAVRQGVTAHARARARRRRGAALGLTAAAVVLVTAGSFVIPRVHGTTIRTGDAQTLSDSAGSTLATPPAAPQDAGGQTTSAPAFGAPWRTTTLPTASPAAFAAPPDIIRAGLTSLPAGWSIAGWSVSVTAGSEVDVQTPQGPASVNLYSQPVESPAANATTVHLPDGQARVWTEANGSYVAWTRPGSSVVTVWAGTKSLVLELAQQVSTAVTPLHSRLMVSRMIDGFRSVESEVGQAGNKSTFCPPGADDSTKKHCFSITASAPNAGTVSNYRIATVSGQRVLVSPDGTGLQWRDAHNAPYDLYNDGSTAPANLAALAAILITSSLSP